MKRSRVALTLFLGTLAVSLAAVGTADERPAPGIECHPPCAQLLPAPDADPSRPSVAKNCFDPMIYWNCGYAMSLAAADAGEVAAFPLVSAEVAPTVAQSAAELCHGYDQLGCLEDYYPYDGCEFDINACPQTGADIADCYHVDPSYFDCHPPSCGYSSRHVEAGYVAEAMIEPVASTTRDNGCRFDWEDDCDDYLYDCEYDCDVYAFGTQAERKHAVPRTGSLADVLADPLNYQAQRLGMKINAANDGVPADVIARKPRVDTVWQGRRSSPESLSLGLLSLRIQPEANPPMLYLLDPHCLPGGSNGFSLIVTQPKPRTAAIDGAGRAVTATLGQSIRRLNRQGVRLGRFATGLAEGVSHSIDESTCAVSMALAEGFARSARRADRQARLEQTSRGGL